MENENLSPEQEQLFKLLLLANQKQSNEIIGEIKQSINTVTETIVKTNNEVEDLKRKCLNLERKSRKNNVLVFGLNSSQEGTDLLKSTLQQINVLLGTQIKEQDINNIYKVGKSANPPIAIEFVTFLKKISLFHDKEKLKALKDHRISIANDLCPEDREEQKILRNHLKIARAQNHDAKIKGYKLIINNIPYSAEDLKAIENQIEESSSEDEVSEEEHSEIDSIPLDEITLKQKSKSIPTSTSRIQPMVELRPNNTSKRKRRKVYKYSPKNTRSKKPDK